MTKQQQLSCVSSLLHVESTSAYPLLFVAVLSLGGHSEGRNIANWFGMKIKENDFIRQGKISKRLAMVVPSLMSSGVMRQLSNLRVITGTLIKKEENLLCWNHAQNIQSKSMFGEASAKREQLLLSSLRVVWMLIYTLPSYRAVCGTYHLVFTPSLHRDSLTFVPDYGSS